MSNGTNNDRSTDRTTLTAAEVLAGVDLTGRTAVVTGGSSGIGLATTRALAAAGARVVVPARRPDTAYVTLADLPGVEVEPLDLADPTSVRECGERIGRRHPVLDILIAGAAIMACPESRVGPGWEAQFAVNHLGHYALVNVLWPALTASGAARVVSIASGRDPSWRINWDDVQFERGYDKWAAYAQSKLANILFARHLDRLGRPHGVHAYSVNPGWVRSPLQRHLTVAEMTGAGWLDDEGQPKPELFRSAEQGAATGVWAATSPELANHGGDHCQDCHVVEPEPTDDAEAARLWALSAALTGLDLSGGEPS